MNRSVRDVLERVASTAYQAFIGALPLTIQLTPDALSAAGWAGLTASIAAVVALIKNLVGAAYARTASGNILERFGWTALQTLIGALPTTFALTIDDGRALALAGINAVVAAWLSLAKNLAAEGAVIEATRRASGGGAHTADLGGEGRAA